MRNLKGKYQLQLDILADDREVFLIAVGTAAGQMLACSSDNCNITKQGDLAGYTLSIKQPKEKDATIASLEEKS